MYRLSDLENKLDKAYTGSDYILARCVFHHPDNNPSMVVYESTQSFYCFACRKSGSILFLTQHLKGIPIAPQLARVGGVKRLRSGSGLRPKFKANLDRYCSKANALLVSSRPEHAYLDSRGLGEAIIRYGLGWERGWFIVPIFDSNAHVLGAVARASPEAEQQTGMRFDIPFGQRSMLYIPDWELWNNSDRVYITFGIFDAISVALAGLPAASPTNGKLSFQRQWLDNVIKPVNFIPDRGEENQAYEYAAKMDWRGGVIRLGYEEGEKDPNDVLVRRGGDELRKEILKL